MSKTYHRNIESKVNPTPEQLQNMADTCTEFGEDVPFRVTLEWWVPDD